MTRSGLVAGASLVALLAACATKPPAPPAPVAPPPAASTSSTNSPADAGEAKVDLLRSVVLGYVHIERGAEGKIGGSVGARLRIEGDLGAGAKEIALRGLSTVRSGGGIELVLAGYPARPDPPTPRDRAASFVIDFDTEEVRLARDRVVREHGDKPSMVDLRRFVAGYIDRKNLSRGYDPASVVAKRREGDCTEHAVLLAALGRSFGFAAHVVHGLVIVEVKNNVAGAMHAWVEWHDGARWIAADAAVGAELDPLYLALAMLDDEGPAFSRSLIVVASHEIRKVTLAPR